MTRCLVVLALVCLTFAISVQWLFDAMRDIDLEAERHRSVRLEKALRDLHTFERHYEAVVDALADGLPLQTAVDQIEGAAEDHYPQYLDRLPLIHSRSTVHERIARNMLLHLRKQAPPAALLNRLDGELAEEFPDLSDDVPCGRPPYFH
jgi:hypothetical protein